MYILMKRSGLPFNNDDDICFNYDINHLLITAIESENVNESFDGVLDERQIDILNNNKKET